MKTFIGAVLGLAAWYVLWFIVPPGFFMFGEPFHYEGNAIVIDDFFGLIGMVVGFFVLPIIGAQVAKGE